VKNRFRQISRRQGVLALVACGAAWAVFCFALDWAGHAPTRAPLPRWYRIQGALLVPWMVLVGTVYATLAQKLSGSEEDRRGALMVSLGLPIGVGFVLPDIAVYALGGFDALWPAMAVYGGLTVLVSVGLGLWVLWDRGAARALLAVVPAWLVQAVLASLLLR
jgi:hypothetical protein